jgi:hypothetical protein
MFNTFMVPFYIPGTLSANHVLAFKAPFDVQLVHVSAVGSNANNALLSIGDSSDDDACLDDFSFGDSGAPEQADRTDFVGEQYPHISGGTVLTLTVDYDGASGTAIQNALVVLTFTEG